LTKLSDLELVGCRVRQRVPAELRVKTQSSYQDLITTLHQCEQANMNTNQITTAHYLSFCLPI